MPTKAGVPSILFLSACWFPAWCFPSFGLSISEPTPQGGLHRGSDQQGFLMGDISVGSVLQTDLPHDHKKSPFWRSMGGGTGLHHFTLLRFKAVVFWYSRSNCRPLLPCSYRFPCTSRWRSRDQKFRELHQLKPGEKILTLLTGPACGQAGAREGARQKCLVRDVWHRAAAAAGLLGHPLSAYTQRGSDICLIPTSKLPTPIEDCKNKVGFKAWCMCYRVGPATTCLFLVQGFYFSFCVPVSV